MSRLYTVTSSSFSGFKFGSWDGSELDLWKRYQTYYGKDMDITLYSCKDMDEKMIRRELTQYRISEELYKTEGLSRCQELCSEKCPSKNIPTVAGHVLATHGVHDSSARRHECEFCHTILSTKQKLIVHQNTAQYCLSARGKDEEVKEIARQNICRHCSGSYSTKGNLNRHMKSCGVTNNTFNAQVNTFNGPVTNNLTQTININVAPSKPFTMADLSKEYILATLAPVLTKEIVKAGMGAITELIVDILLQKDGKYCYYCTNKRDKKFTMLIDHEGQIIHEKDPNAQCLRSILCIPLQRLVGELAVKHEEKRVSSAFKEIVELRRDGGAFSSALASILPANAEGIPESMKKRIEEAENDPEMVELERMGIEIQKRANQKRIRDENPWI